MKYARGLLPMFVCLVLGATGSPALAAQKFRPRVGNALGLIPPVNGQGNFNTEPPELGVFNAVTYHGGPTMTAGGAVHVHVIFWEAPGFAFQGSPGAGIPTYEGLIEQYFTDVAHDSTTGPTPAPGTCDTSECDDFTVEPQYGDGTTVGGVSSGANAIGFTNPGTADTFPGGLTGADVVVDRNPYPDNCASPQDTKGCVLDSEVQTEIDNIIQGEPTQERGLQNLWYVFFPPDVDECISQDVCGTNAFGGYHSLSNVNGHGLTIYAITIDPVIEVGDIAPGGDPQGNPDAEVAADIANHETNEAMTDPTGVGWIDPNAFETADKCEFGPQHGTPLGFATNGSPYNQVINGHKYYMQEIWSQADGGCVQASTKTIADSGLPLPLVNLTQFSPTVTGNIGSATSGVDVEVQLLRAGVVVAEGTGQTLGDGSWTVSLTDVNTGAPIGVGDDRDEIDVIYNDGTDGTPGSGIPLVANQVILTGNGGNPFIEGGWMGWSDMDNGSDVETTSLSLAPCFQTGVLSSSVTATSPTEFCGTASDAATEMTIAPVGAGTRVTWSSLDNRAFQPPDGPVERNDVGGLVNLTVPAGEPGSVSAQGSFVPPDFSPTGFPTCTADLGAQSASCSGLVPGDRYTVNGVGATAADDGMPGDGIDGTITVAIPVHRGDTIALKNSVNRTLTTLHVANLRVDLTGDGSTVTSGTCSADEYWGGPLTGPVLNDEAGEFDFGGPAGTGQICAGGDAHGLPSDALAQTDDQSGGQTVTEVARLADSSPLPGETVYGTFTALAIPSDGTSPVSLSVTKAGGSPEAITSNAATANGVTVSGLAPGNYTATWVISDANGDTRTVTTRFIEQSALQGAQGPPGPPAPPPGHKGPKPVVKCKLLKHNKIKCSVTFPHNHKQHGIVRLAVSRGGKLVALGHATVKHGHATVTMRELRVRSRGAWAVTVVFSRTVKVSTTNTVAVSVK